MIILDPPYISEELRNYLINGQIPVLKNAAAIQALGAKAPQYRSEEQCLQLLANGQRLYTCSENSIDWIIEHTQSQTLRSSMENMKNKKVFRDLLAPAYPDFFYQQASLEQLLILDTSHFSYPFILKPQIGFFSVGVYVVTSLNDWKLAVSDLLMQAEDWSKTYPKSVVNTEFILEQYIHGEEFAIDAYYDETGKAVILNILKHDFDGMSDVSDRLYYTGKTILETHLAPFTKWLTEMNQFFKITNFPFHAEIRIQNGHITPIEFNPLRFAGWCCTDISYFAFGFHTYDYYLHNKKPDWKSLLNQKDGKLYTVIVLDKPSNANNQGSFDYDAACRDMGKILCLRKINHKSNPIFGFLFTELDETDRQTMRSIVEKNFGQFVFAST